MTIRMSKCDTCKHLYDDGNYNKCAAFLDGIPEDVAWGRYCDLCTGDFHYIDQDGNPYDDSHPIDSKLSRFMRIGL